MKFLVLIEQSLGRDIESVGEELAKATCSIYAAESMIYLTTGLLDDFVGQDAEIEAAITKVFTAEKLMEMAIQPLRFVGPQALTKGHPLEVLFRNSVQFFGQTETIDSVKFFVALSGLQHAGVGFVCFLQARLQKLILSNIVF